MNVRRNAIRADSSQPAWLVAWIRCLVLAFAAWGVFAFVLNRAEPHTISGDSMAPALRGAALLWRCSECRFPFTTTLTSTDLPTCANCGRRNIPSNNATVREADQVALSAHNNASRLDLLAYKGEDERKMIKRVWGLPGEQASIAEGDLWINGRRFQKSLAQFRQVAQLVHDTAFASPEHSRWSSGQMTHHMDSSGGRFFVGTGRGEVRYDHTVSYATTKPRTDPSPLYDHYPHNVGTSRQLHPVRDVVFDVTLSGDSLRSLEFRLTGNGVDVVCQGRIQGARWNWDVGNDAAAASDVPPPNRSFQLTMGVCDGRLLLALDGRTVLVQPVPDNLPKAASEKPLRIVGSFSGGRCVIRRVQIWRDIHFYADPRAIDQWQLGANQWLVLGDNQPESLDSRHVGPVAKKDILGACRWRRP